MSSSITDRFNAFIEDGDYAESTKQTYSGVTDRFVEFLSAKQVHSVYDLTSRHGIDYFRGIVSSAPSKRTECFHISVLNQLYLYLYKSGCDWLDIGELIVGIDDHSSDKKKTKTVLSGQDIDDIETFLGYFDRRNNDSWKYNGVYFRDRAMFYFMAHSGSRVAEVSRAKVSDLVDGENAINLTIKGGRAEKVYFTDEARKRIDDYLFMRKGYSDFLFENSSKRHSGKWGAGISPRGIQKAMEKYLGLLGLNQKLSPHSLRHYFLTVIYKKSNIETAKFYANHLCTESTELYVHHQKNGVIKPCKRLDGYFGEISVSQSSVFKQISLFEG